MKIPSIVHQMWGTRDVPAHLGSYMRTWPILHPGWEVWLWTDDDLNDLIASRYPGLLPWFFAAPLDVVRFDLGRYLILHAYGGIYADADYEAYQPFDRPLSGARLVFGWEWSGSPNVTGVSAPAWRRELEVAVGEGFTVGNAVMGSVRSHPFWSLLVEQLVRERPSAALQSREVWDLSGPAALTRALAKWRPEGTRILTSAELYPITWHRPQLDDGFRWSDFPAAYGAHHWAGTWWQPRPARAQEQTVRLKMHMRPPRICRALKT